MLSLFWFAVLTVAIFYIMTQYARPGLPEISAAVVAVFVIYYLSNTANVQTQTYFEETDRMLTTLGPYDHLHHDADVIHLIYSVVDFRPYNPDAFDRMLRQINHGLSIVADYTDRGATIDCLPQFELTESYFNRALFYFDSLAVTIPATKQAYHRHLAARQRLQLLLKRQTDRMRVVCPSKTSTYEGPRPYNAGV